jgi:hypothetical protein
MRARAALCLALVAPVVPAAGQRLAYEDGLSLSTGTYFFTERTTSWMLVSGLAAAAGRVTVRASFPLYAQNTTLVTQSAGGMMPTGGSLAGTVSDSGQAHEGRRSSGGMVVPVPESAVTGYETVLGDPLAQATAQLVSRSHTTVTAGVTLKVPLTDTTEYGTGEWDVGALVAATQWIGNGFLALDLSYWHLGDMPQLDFQNPITASLTYGRRWGTAWIVSLAATGGTSAIRGYANPASVGATVGHLGSALWTASVTVGLTETTPDLAIGLAWRVGL